MLTDPQHDDSLALTEDDKPYIRRPVSGEEAVEYGHDLMSLLVSADWEVSESELEKGPSWSTMVRLAYYWQVLGPPPDPPIPEEDRPPAPDQMHLRIVFGDYTYVSYDPNRYVTGAVNVGGNIAIWFPAGATTSVTADAFVSKVNEYSEYWTISRLADQPLGITSQYVFRVTTRDGGFSRDNVDLHHTYGLQGPKYTSGGHYTLRSQYIMRDVFDEEGNLLGQAPEGQRLKLELRTVYWTPSYPGQAKPDTVVGALRIEMKVTLDEGGGGGGEYRQVLQLSHDSYANPHQFVLWGGHERGQVLVSMLKSHPNHLMGASPLFILSPESDVWANLPRIPVNNWTSSVYWRDGFTEGFNGQINYFPPWQLHAYTAANGYVDGAHPTLMVRGSTGTSLTARNGLPLAQAPWVVLAADPRGGVAGSIAGKLWDMVVLSGPIGDSDMDDLISSGGAMVYHEHQWDLLATNGGGGSALFPDVKVTLWIRRKKEVTE